MVWTWSKNKLRKFVRAVTLIEIKRLYSKLKTKILSETKDLVKDEVAFKLPLAFQRAREEDKAELMELTTQIASAIAEIHSEIKSLEIRVDERISCLEARIASLEESSGAQNVPVNILEDNDPVAMLLEAVRKRRALR